MIVLGDLEEKGVENVGIELGDRFEFVDDVLLWGLEVVVIEQRVELRVQARRFGVHGWRIWVLFGIWSSNFICN